MGLYRVCVAFVAYNVEDGDCVAMSAGQENSYFATEQVANEFYEKSLKSDFRREEDGYVFIRFTNKPERV